MVSQPSYDPNRLASHDFSEVRRRWERLTTDDDQPMLNRGTQQILPPGSTFKLVTAAAALENGSTQPDDKVKAGTHAVVPRHRVHAAQRERQQLRRRQDHVRAGAQRLVQRRLRRAGRQGRPGRSSPSRRPSSASAPIRSTASRRAPAASPPRAPTSRRRSSRRPASASSRSRPRPLQMAMVAGGIANDGDVMKPYIVKTVRSPNLRVLDQAEPERLGQAMSSANAAKLTQMMVSTVERGTATSAQIAGVDVGGQDRHGAVHRGPPAVRLVRGDSPRPTTRRSRSPWWSSPATPPATRSPAAAWPARSPAPSWRRCWANEPDHRSITVDQPSGRLTP